MNKVTIAVIIAIVVAFGGLIYFANTLDKPTPEVDYSQIDASKIIKDTDDNGGIADHVRGKEDSPVVFVEYADFQCPGCASAMSTVEELYKSYGDRVAFVFRNFPLSAHPNARSAAAAAEAAAQQGYFWEMATTLYGNQASWKDQSGMNRTNQYVELFAGIAPTADFEKFRKDMNDENIAKKIDYDYNLGYKVAKVTATPAFYVNGEAIDVISASTQNDLKKLMEDALNKQLKENNLPTGPAKVSLTK